MVNQIKLVSNFKAINQAKIIKSNFLDFLLCFTGGKIW